MKNFLLLLLLLTAVNTYSKESNYVFGWTHLEDSNLKIPRGGTTTGPEVILDNQVSDFWIQLQNPNLTKFEKDRIAILAMQGKYRVYFDFMETMGFVENYQPKQPYQSWATEFVEVVDDQKDFISLQHIIVMYFKQEDGSVSDPVVMKHWRQDWHYEDSKISTYTGNETWKKVNISWAKKRGTWSQSAYQVDDTPRYQSYGKWSHSENFSSWASEETWRPLPRREFSIRDDYDVMVGNNIQTITPTGWVHEQNNKKVVLNDNHKVLAKEIGIARYERIKDFDWNAGEDYWGNTKNFWREVREAWNNKIDNSKSFKLFKEVNGEILFSKLFTMAEQYAEGDTSVLNQIKDIIEIHSESNK